MDKSFALLSVVLLLTTSWGCATTPLAPKVGTTPELAIQQIIARRLGIDVVALQIETFAEYDDWAFLAGVPRTAEGQPIDYTGTPYAKDKADGYFDDNFAALVRRSTDEDGGWIVVELSIGATDAPFVDWLDRYGLPPDLVSTTSR